MTIGTIIIPVSNAHITLAENAVVSAERQTIPIAVQVYEDKQGRGAGYARNRYGLHVATPFVTFLDADDTLEPDYIEKCLNAYERGHYVYSGWYGSAPIMPAADNPYKGDGFHLVTTLIPSAAFKAVGGFDEDLPGHEDADLHFKLMGAGVCGILAPYYLVHYSAHGTRGKQFRERPDYEIIRQQVYERNGGDQMASCCGMLGNPAAPNVNQRQEGDVWAIATWVGMKNQASANGQRVYRGGNHQPLWVAPEDIAAFPDKFKKLHSLDDLTPNKEDVLKSAGLL